MVKINKIRFFLFIISFVFLYANNVNQINVITTNDIHGVIGEQDANFMNPNFPPKIIGGAAFYKYVKDLDNKLSSQNESLLILDGGNFFQGHPVGIVDSGKTIIEWMNKIQYSAMVPGQEDFMYGYENLINLSKIADFPFLASNIYYKDTNELVFQPYIQLTVNDVKIGIIGVVSSNMNEYVLKKNIDGIYFTSEVKAINKSITKLQELDSEIIILLSSLGVPWDRDEVYDQFILDLNTGNVDDSYEHNSLSLGYFADNIDFIISGGISKGYKSPWYDQNSHVYIFQNYGNGTEFGHFLINYNKKTHNFTGYENVVSNSISQTLFIDDFNFDQNQYKWLQKKIKKSIENTYREPEWFALGISDKKNITLSNNIQNRIDIFPDNDSLTIIKKSRWDVPSINTDKIDIITWNCEFFPTFGDSTIDALSEVIVELNPDIIAFQEIKKKGWFDKLMDKLPEYNFIISAQSSFMDQAIIFKNDLFSFINKTELFAEDDYNYAGRPPLKCDLIYLPSNKKISIINLHMKCCDSGLLRRKKASMMLHEYLDQEIENNFSNFIVLGDWNDDLKDKEGEHCFKPFMSDDRFFFPTLDITYDITQASYPKEPYVSFLDHILVSNTLLENTDYIVKTIPMDKYMGSFENYEKYISDHMPVLFTFE